MKNFSEEFIKDLNDYCLDHLEHFECFPVEFEWQGEVYKFEEIPISVEPLSVFMLVGATLLTALLFSFLPAWRAARLPVIRAIWRR